MLISCACILGRLPGPQRLADQAWACSRWAKWAWHMVDLQWVHNSLDRADSPQKQIVLHIQSKQCTYGLFWALSWRQISCSKRTLQAIAWTATQYLCRWRPTPKTDSIKHDLNPRSSFETNILILQLQNRVKNNAFSLPNSSVKGPRKNSIRRQCQKANFKNNYINFFLRSDLTEGYRTGKKKQRTLTKDFENQTIQKLDSFDKICQKILQKRKS